MRWRACADNRLDKEEDPELALALPHLMLTPWIPCLPQCCRVTRCRVPASLPSVTSVGDSEVNPRLLGVQPEGIARIWAAVERLYASGIHPAIQLCVRHQGRVLIDRAIGHARGNGPDDPPDAEKVLATPETPFTIFSASKAVTAMIIHLLDEQNLIRLDDPVCEYIPEFAVKEKQRITIRHVLTHRAGIPTIPPETIDLDLLAEPDRILRIICEAEPRWPPGRRLAYHSITGGFILGELVRRVRGRDIRAVFDAVVRQPLGLRWMGYGVAVGDIPQVAINYFTGPPVLPPASMIFRRALGANLPITAYEAQSGQVLRTKNRPGNVHDGKGSLRFLRDLFSQIHRSLGTKRVLEFCMDGAFFRRDVIELLEAQGAEYAIKVPFMCWTGLKALVRGNHRWSRVDDAVSFFEKRLFLQPWQREMRVVIYRKKVHHETRKNFQLDLFDPADGHYEYSAVTTNKDLSGPFLWHFMCGRGGHEKAYAELKNGFAFDSVPSLRYVANSAWQLISVLAFDLMRGFQVSAAAHRRPFAARRRPLFAFANIQTLRY